MNRWVLMRCSGKQNLSNGTEKVCTKQPSAQKVGVPVYNI